MTASYLHASPKKSLASSLLNALPKTGALHLFPLDSLSLRLPRHLPCCPHLPRCDTRPTWLRPHLLTRPCRPTRALPTPTCPSCLPAGSRSGTIRTPPHRRCCGVCRAPPWLRPAPCPANTARSRKYYYVQISTGVSQWDLPTSEAPIGGSHHGTPAQNANPYNRPAGADGPGDVGGGERGMGGEGQTGDRSLGGFAMNALMGNNKQSHGSGGGGGGGGSGNLVGQLAGSFLGGGKQNHGGSGGGSSNLVGQLAGSLLGGGKQSNSHGSGQQSGGGFGALSGLLGGGGSNNHGSNNHGNNNQGSGHQSSSAGGLGGMLGGLMGGGSVSAANRNSTPLC